MLTRRGDASAVPCPRCPRCGYDQRGVIETWRESCPLEGVCSECGLEFEWRELLRPELQTPHWCVEHERSALAFPRQVVTTVLRAWRPWRMWREMRLTHELRPRRLTAYLIALVIVILMAVCVANGLAAWAEWNEWQLTARVVVRGVPGGGPPPAVRWLTPNESGWVIFIRGALTPLSGESSGSFALVPGVAAAAMRTMPRGLKPPRAHLTDAFGKLGPACIFVGSISVCTGLAFLALPMSRRMAKVRWEHIIRVTAYSFGTLIPLGVLTILGYGLTQTNLPGQNAFATVVVLGWIAFLPMLFVYWSFAAGRYLRMSHPWAVGLAVVVLGALAPISVAGVLWVLMD